MDLTQDQLKELDYKLELVPPPGFPQWDVQREIDKDYDPPTWVKDQRRANRELFKKRCKAAGILEAREKKQRHEAKLRREEAKRMKRKQMIDEIMAEMDDAKNKTMKSPDLSQKDEMKSSSNLSSSQLSTYSQSQTSIETPSVSAKKKKVFVSVSARKKKKYPPPDPNAAHGSLITDYAKKLKKTPSSQPSSQATVTPIETPILHQARSRSSRDHVAHLKPASYCASPLASPLAVSTVSHTPSTMNDESCSAKSTVKTTKKEENEEEESESEDGDNDDDSVSVKTMELPASMLCDPCEVRPGKCLNCFGTFPKCCELLYRTMCLQAVMDYFDKVGVVNATHIGVRHVFHACFMTQVRPVLLKKYGRYETELLQILKCMILGSLKDALSMHRGGKVFKHLMNQRMADVEDCFKAKEALEQFHRDYDDGKI